MRARATSVLAVTLLLLVPSGCGLFDDDGDAAGTSTTPPTTTVAPDPEPEVLEVGAAPRKELRLRFTAGDTTTVAIAFDLDVTQESAGTTQELDTPVVTETVRFTVDAVEPGAGPDGGPEAQVSFAFTAVSLDRAGTDLTEQEHAELTADLQGLVGLGGSGRLDDRGAFRDLAYELPDGLDPSVEASLRQFEDQLSSIALPLPTEPLGVGGRWRTTTTTTLAGVTLDQVTTYEVTALTDTGVAYAATTEQVAEEGDLDPATLADGSTARLLSSDVTGTGTGTMDLASLVATASTRLTGTQVVELAAEGGEPIRLTQQLDVGLTVEPAG